MPSSSSNRFENKATSSSNRTDADADTRWMTPTDDAMPRSAQGYFPSTTKGFEAEQLKRPAMDSRRRIGSLAQDSKQANFNERFHEVARVKIL